MKRIPIVAAIVLPVWLCLWAEGRAVPQPGQGPTGRAATGKAPNDAGSAGAAGSLAPGEPERLGLQGPPSDLAAAYSPALGPEDAPVEIVVFSDFQCPYCARLEPLLRQIHQIWPKEVRVAVKSFPLSSHRSARLAAEAADAAAAQGCYWPFRQRLFDFFANQKGPLTRDRLSAIAVEAGLDVYEFERDLNLGLFGPAVDRDREDGEEAGVSSTPTLFVDGWLWTGERSIDALRPAIELLLAAKGRRTVLRVTRTFGREDGVCDEDCSLGEAIAAANDRKGPQVLRLPPGRWSVVPKDLPLVTEDLTIAGDPSGSTVLVVPRAGRVFRTSRPGVRLSLAELTVEARPVKGHAGAGKSAGFKRRLRPEDCYPPMEARDLVLSGAGETAISWTAPVDPGDFWVTYDVLRSDSASDFSAATCLLIDDMNQSTTDTETPTGVWYYLVRSRNTCGTNLGTDSVGAPRYGVTCVSGTGSLCNEDPQCDLGACCGGWCTDIGSDVYNCGSCWNSCTSLPQVNDVSCSYGACVINSCQPDYQDCNGDPYDGCESDSQTDIYNCGYCGNDCTMLYMVNDVSCTSGGCVINSCQPGYAHCTGDVSNGCETDLTDPATCGSCSNDCWEIPYAAAVSCSAGSCVVDACQEGYDFCDESHTSCCGVKKRAPSSER